MSDAGPPGPDECLELVTTVADRSGAHAMARSMIERGLAACAHVAPVDSLYRWQGRLHEAIEYQVVLKTTRERYAALERAVRAVHPYELPDIHAVALLRVHEPYARWIAESCRERTPSGAGGAVDP